MTKHFDGIVKIASGINDVYRSAFQAGEVSGARKVDACLSVFIKSLTPEEVRAGQLFEKIQKLLNSIQNLTHSL